MRPTNLEALIPGLKDARDSEHLNRALCFAGLTWTIEGEEVLPMTPRHKLELQLTRNCFFVVGHVPDAADVYQFLWRLNPGFKRNGLSLAKARIWLKTRLMTRQKALIAALAISDYLHAMIQDLPEGGEESGGQEYGAYVHWLASDITFFLRRFQGFTADSYMDTPYLVLQQLIRAYRINVEEDPDFINDSDRIAGLWLRKNAPKKS